MSLLLRITYISRVSPSVVTTDLRQIVGLAEVLHRRKGLSGVLAYTGRHFLQVIEGAPLDVDGLLTLIRADSRHDQICLLRDDEVATGLFDRWYSLHVECPDLIDEVGAAHTSCTESCNYAAQLEERLVRQLKADDLMN